MPPKTKPADPRLRVGRAVRKKFTGSGWFDGSVTSIADGSFEVRWSDGDEISYPFKAATKMLDAAEKPSGKKKPVAKPQRKQLATKKPPPPQKRPPPTPSSSSEDDDEIHKINKISGAASDSDNDNWRDASAAECKKRWGAECPFKDIVFHLVQRDEEVYEETGELETYAETHEFTSGTVKPAVEKWTCPSLVEYKPRKGDPEWFTISENCSILGSFEVDVREDDEYNYEMRFDLDCEIDLDTQDVIHLLKEQKGDGEKSKKKSKSKYYNLNAGCWFGGTVHFDVKIEDAKEEVFKLRVRSANFSIEEWSDVLERLEREPKSPRPKGPLKQLAKKPAAKPNPTTKPELVIGELKGQIESLEGENAKLKRRLARYEGKVLDLTAEDSDDEAPPPRSKLRELHDKQTTKRAAKIKKERDDHESRGELLDSMVSPLERQRRELQEIVSAAAEALMERDVPTRMLADDAAPFYYSQNSWEAEQEIPWNAEADRPMSLAEGIAWVHDNAKPPRKRRR